MRSVIKYEEGDLPGIAIAPDHFDVSLAMMWVRSHQEPMMMIDHDHYMLVFIAADNSVQIESPSFRGVIDASKAADMIRTWLRHQGLIDPEDLRGRADWRLIRGVSPGGRPTGRGSRPRGRGDAE